MGQLAAVKNRQGFRPASGPTTEQRPRRGRARIYRDVGLAAVAAALEIPTTDLEPELSRPIKRGARFLFLMAKPRAAA
jgi:hypothetical protein